MGIFRPSLFVLQANITGPGGPYPHHLLPLGLEETIENGTSKLQYAWAVSRLPLPLLCRVREAVLTRKICLRCLGVG